MDEKLGTELVFKNGLSLINDNECNAHIFVDAKASSLVQMKGELRRRCRLDWK